jgi:hypothetical protein
MGFDSREWNLGARFSFGAVVIVATVFISFFSPETGGFAALVSTIGRLVTDVGGAKVVSGCEAIACDKCHR